MVKGVGLQAEIEVLKPKKTVFRRVRDPKKAKKVMNSDEKLITPIYEDTEEGNSDNTNSMLDPMRFT